MIRRQTDSDARWTLRASVIDGCAWAVMYACGQDNIVVFAIALGLGDAFSGLLASIPSVVGALLQLATPWGVGHMGSHRRWTVVGCFFQALSFSPLIFAAVLGHAHPALLFIAASCYWFGGFSCAATWHTLMSGAVPRRVRPRFFEFRMRAINLILIIATAANGVFIEVMRRQGHILGALATLFGIGLIARIVSATYLSAQVERVPMPKGYRHVPLREFLARFTHGEAGRAIALLLGMQVGLQMSVPFLQPYLLRRLHLENEFTSYGIVMAAVLVGKIVALPLWGRWAHSGRVGTLLWIGCAGLVPVPAMWLISGSLPMAIAVQFYTGVVTAAFEYAAFLRLFESVHDNERTSIITWYQAAWSLAVLLGSTVGAKLLSMSEAQGLGYMWLFISAAGVRLLALPLVVRAMGPRVGKPPPLAPTTVIPLPHSTHETSVYSATRDG